eukprot:TRINITY_DN10303_c0_g3_i4.p2 TRINITY_DN10303_c0_g3~~TRINITY_DN10303_c0_g3_i4.p2  ORF type:complete len:106 (-),score=0.60 TRINITY_DN10303_c0_g3_i4:1163-1480(-)
MSTYHTFGLTARSHKETLTTCRTTRPPKAREPTGRKLPPPPGLEAWHLPLSSTIIDSTEGRPSGRSMKVDEPTNQRIRRVEGGEVVFLPGFLSSLTVQGLNLPQS